MRLHGESKKACNLEAVAMFRSRSNRSRERLAKLGPTSRCKPTSSVIELPSTVIEIVRLVHIGKKRSYNRNTEVEKSVKRYSQSE